MEGKPFSSPRSLAISPRSPFSPSSVKKQHMNYNKHLVEKSKQEASFSHSLLSAFMVRLDSVERNLAILTERHIRQPTRVDMEDTTLQLQKASSIDRDSITQLQTENKKLRDDIKAIRQTLDLQTHKTTSLQDTLNSTLHTTKKHNASTMDKTFFSSMKTYLNNNEDSLFQDHGNDTDLLTQFLQDDNAELSAQRYINYIEVVGILKQLKSIWKKDLQSYKETLRHELIDECVAAARESVTGELKAQLRSEILADLRQELNKHPSPKPIRRKSIEALISESPPRPRNGLPPASPQQIPTQDYKSGSPTRRRSPKSPRVRSPKPSSKRMRNRPRWK